MTYFGLFEAPQYYAELILEQLPQHVQYGTVRYNTSSSAYFVEASVTYAAFTNLAGEFYI